MKKLLSLLFIPFLLVSCSSDDDDVDNPDGFLTKNKDVLFIEVLDSALDEYADFLIFSPNGVVDGEFYFDDPTYYCYSDFYTWNVALYDDVSGLTTKYEVTENTSDTVKVKYTVSYDGEELEAILTAKLDGNVLTVTGTDPVDGDQISTTFARSDEQAPC